MLQLRCFQAHRLIDIVGRNGNRLCACNLPPIEQLGYWKLSPGLLLRAGIDP